MLIGGISRRYAEALVKIGIDEDKAEAFLSELKIVHEIIESNENLKMILFGSVYPQQTKKNIVLEILKVVNVSKDIRNFIFLLIDKDRIVLFSQIIKGYEEIHDKKVGRIRATVIVVRKSQEEVLNKLEGALQKITGKTVVLEIEEDPSIIGGVITKLGNLIFDGSIKTQLERVRQAMVGGR